MSGARLGVTLPQFRDQPGAALEALDHAEELGYRGAFVFDHLWPLGGKGRPVLEGWTLLAALAGHLRAGSRLRLGTLVTRAGLRPPALLAHMAATVGMVAGAPPIVGVGGGDAASRPENEAFGLPYRDAEGRGAEVERAVAALRGPLAGRAGPVEVWVGGVAPRTRLLAGRVADGWNRWGATPEELAAGLVSVREAALAAGRDPRQVKGTWGGQVLVAETGAEAARLLARWREGRDPGEVRRTVAGDPAAVTGRLAALAEAGADWCVIGFVGGRAAHMRTLLADAADLGKRG